MADDGGEFGDITDVSHSAAYLTLDALVEQKKIVVERANYLKEQYKKLHDRVLGIYNNDNFLLKRMKIIRKDLDNEKAKVEKCHDTAREDDGTIQKLKRELALAENELSVAQEKESILQVETIELERKRTSLQNEVDDAIAEEEARMRPTIDALTKAITELKDEIESTAEKFEKYKTEREEVVTKEGGLKESMRRQETEIYERRLELTKNEREPERAKKQADIVERATQTAEKELRQLMDKLTLLNTTITEHERKKKNMEEQRYELALTLETQRTAIEQRERTMHTIERNLSTEKESNFKLVQQSTQLEADLKNLTLAHNREKEAWSKTLRDKETALKNCRRLEQLKRELTDERDTLLKQKEILQRELIRIKGTRATLHDEMEELKRDVDVLINNFLKEEKSESNQREELQQLLLQIKEMERQIGRKAEEEGANTRVISELSIHRENKSRDASKNKGKVASAKDELKVKEVVVKELQKRNNELLQRLQQLTEMYSVVKRERSNKAALIQSASQAMSETQEKIKILDNELEVLRRESMAKDKALSKTRRELHNERTNCENLRIEANKLYATLKQKKKAVQEQCSQITKLNTVITATEDDMLHLKRNYEDAVEGRNFTGIQLIDRNDELCILYEKANIQENILKNGQKELSSREEQIRAMAIQLADLQRQIENCQRQLPKVKEYEDQLSGLSQDLTDEKWRAGVLEEDLVDPKNTTRWRNLGSVRKGAGAEGDAEDPAVLAQHEQELDQKLNREQERLMEKKLVLNEMQSIGDKLRAQAVGGRDATLEIAKQVNHRQHDLQQKTKKIQAHLSELSMDQAKTYRLQGEVEFKQQEIQEASERMAVGMAPNEQIEAEFYRTERDRQRRKEQLMTSQLLREQERNMPPQLTRSTAQQRANAYIPDGGADQLKLPKPYGKFAPVAPKESANLVKHTRKPKVQEVQL